jgi:hypothetical protein
MPKKIHKLSEKESFDFRLIGIASPENDYRFSWVVNHTMGFKLVREEDLEIWHKLLDDPQVYHQFRYFDEETLLQYRLISNKCENGYLLEEMTKVDYLIQIIGEVNELEIKKLVKDLNKIDGITLAFLLDPSTLKSAKKLLV